MYSCACGAQWRTQGGLEPPPPPIILTYKNNGTKYHNLCWIRIFKAWIRIFKAWIRIFKAWIRIFKPWIRIFKPWIRILKQWGTVAGGGGGGGGLYQIMVPNITICFGASGTRKHTNKHIKLLSHYSNISNNEFDIPSIIFERFAYLKPTPKAYMLKISPPPPPIFREVSATGGAPCFFAEIIKKVRNHRCTTFTISKSNLPQTETKATGHHFKYVRPKS